MRRASASLPGAGSGPSAPGHHTGPTVALVRDALEAVGVAAEVVAPGHMDGATSLERLASGPGDPFADPRLSQEDLAVVPFSSGTGGLPKGVRLTHGNLAASSAQVAASLGCGPRTVALAAVPFSHVMGLGLSPCVPLGVGAPIVTLPVPDTSRILEAIAEHRVTHAIVPLPVFTEFAADPRVERHDTSSLALLATAGAHVPAAVELAAGRGLGTLARQGYGMTEATTMISGPMDLDRPGDPGTVGWLAAGTEARLVDPDSGRDVPPGRAGELWIRGPQVMAGYYDDPDATAATITADGWLRTGDLVTIGDDGQLLIKDRLKELLKVDGTQVPRPSWSWYCASTPRSATPPWSDDPTPGPARSGRLHRPGLAGNPRGADLLRRHAPGPHKRLHGVHIVDELPRMPTGKPLRRVLRDRERHAAEETSTQTT